MSSPSAALTATAEEPFVSLSASPQPFQQLTRSVHSALETYSNVHRGSGQDSQISTELYEHARDILLDYLGLTRKTHTLIFCSPLGADALKEKLTPGKYAEISSEEFGLPLGLRALAVDKRALPRGAPPRPGGGTVKLVSARWSIWADAPDKFEAGTPPVISAITLARASQLAEHGARNISAAAGMPQMSARDILYSDEFGAKKGVELLEALRRTETGYGEKTVTEQSQGRYIHLDNAASTPTFSPVWDSVWQTWCQPKQTQRDVITESRKVLSTFLGAPLDDYEIIFTSNTTEAINIAAKNFAAAPDDGTEPVVVNTLLEHHSNELPWRHSEGVSLLRMNADNEGFVDLERLESLLREYNQEHRHGKKRIKLLALCGASNVLGSCNDIEAMSRIAHQYGAAILVDAAQLAAHRKIDMQKCDIDYLAMSAHKMYAPFGSGALIVRKSEVNFDPTNLEKIKASGEENAGGIAGFAKAILLLERIGLDVIEAEERRLTHQMLDGLKGIRDVRVLGVDDPASPNFSKRSGVVSFYLNKVPHNVAAKELAELGGIGVRDGCFCAHLLVKHALRISPVRQRMADFGLILKPNSPTGALPGVVRASIGIETVENDIQHFLETLKTIAERPRGAVERLSARFRNGMPTLPKTAVQKELEEDSREKIEEVLSG